MGLSGLGGGFGELFTQSNSASDTATVYYSRAD
jgi:hypothetical protein